MSQQTDNTKLTTIVLDGNKNYIPWSRSVTLALSGRGKLNFVTGTKKKPKPAKPNEATAAETEKIEEWQTTDHMIMTWLLNTMEPQIANSFMYYNSFKEVWDKARIRFGQQKNFAHIYSLKQEIAKIKQVNQSNTQLVTEITSKWEELNVYLPPTTDPTEIQKRAQQDLIFTYLGALDSSYEAIRSQILLSSEMPSFDDVVATIEQEESRRALMNPSKQDTSEAKAYAARTNRNFKEAKLKGAPSSVDKCDHCKKQGHTRDGCFFLHPHLRPN